MKSKVTETKKTQKEKQKNNTKEKKNKNLQAQKRVYSALGDYKITDYQMLLQKDFDALKAILENKKYFFGDIITSVGAFCWLILAGRLHGLRTPGQFLLHQR